MVSRPAEATESHVILRISDVERRRRRLASVTLSGASGLPGSTVTVTGSGYLPKPFTVT
jgi:hypothetical protein